MRININGMNIEDVILSLSDGNPGAMTVLIDSYKEMPSIDPDDAFGPLGFMLHLDHLEIYGENIWKMYKDLCQEDLTTTIAMARACQLGILRSESLMAAIMDPMLELNTRKIVKKVRDRLPNFACTT
jgi:hypothetical protein